VRGWRFGDCEFEVEMVFEWRGRGCRRIWRACGRYDEFVPLVLGRLRSGLGGYRAGGCDDCRGGGDAGCGDVLENVDGEGVEEFVGEDEGGCCCFCMVLVLVVLC
jgi:hypothetical protein